MRGREACVRYILCAPCEAGARKVFDPSAKEKRREENTVKRRRERSTSAAFARLGAGALNVSIHAPYILVSTH